MILVVGATGLVGGMMVKGLLEKGHSVRILVRPQSKASFQPLVEKGAQPVLGDLKDRASLDQVCEGVDALLTTANSARRGGGDTLETVEILGNRNLIGAAKAAKVQHVIFTSALGADVMNPVPFLRSRGLAEAYLRESGLDYTVLQANLILDLWLGIILGRPLETGQPVRIIGEGKRRHSFVAAKDIAAFAIATLHHPAARRQTLKIGGPQALSWLNVVEMARRALGRELPVQHYASGDPEAVAGLPPEGGAALDGLMTHLDSFDSPLDMTELALTYGVHMTAIEDLLRETFVRG